MEHATKADLGSGFGLAALGVLAFIPAQEMSEMGGVFPRFASAIAVLCGTAIAVRALLGRAQMRTELVTPSWRTLVGALGLAAWGILLPVFGFATTSIGGFILLAAISGDGLKTARAAVCHAVAAMVLGIGFSLLLEHVLHVAMP